MSTGLLAALLGLSGAARALEASPPGPGWTEVQRSEQLALFVRDQPETGAREIYAVTEVAAPPRVVFEVLTDFARYTEFMPYTEQTRVLGRPGPGRVEVYQRLALPVVDARDYVMAVELQPGTEENGGVYQSRWTSDPGALPPTEGCVRVPLNTGSWTVEPRDEGRRSRLVHTLVTSPGGDVPAWLADRSNTVAVPALLAAVRRRALSLARQRG